MDYRWWFSRWLKGRALVAVGAAFPAMAVGAQATASGPNVEEQPVACLSAACASHVEADASERSPSAPVSAGNQIVEVDKTTFCSALSRANPDARSCSASAPPSSPEFDPRWQSDGCITDTHADAVVASLLSADDESSGIVGNPDAPLPGVSFNGACRSHARCYGTAEDRQSCDEKFLVALEDACNAASPTYHAACRELAGDIGQPSRNSPRRPITVRRPIAPVPRGPATCRPTAARNEPGEKAYRHWRGGNRSGRLGIYPVVGRSIARFGERSAHRIAGRGGATDA